MESRHHSFMDFLRGDLTEKMHFYRARVRLLATLVSDSLTDSCLVDLMAMNDTNCLMFSQQLLKAVKRLKQVV